MRKIISAMGLALLLWCILVSPVMVLAATGDTSIYGQVPGDLSISTPGTFSLESLNPGTTVDSNAKTVTIGGNSSNWTLTVSENGGGDGKMARSDSHPLTNPLKVMGGDVKSYTSLASPVTLQSAGNGAVTISDIYFEQIVDAGELAGTYSITVVFTVTSGA